MKKRISWLLIFCLIFTIAFNNSGTAHAANGSKTVKSIKLTNISTNHVIKKGKKFTVKYKVTPSGANKGVKWKSSNKKIATVSKKGVIKAKKKGTVTITMTSKNNPKVRKSFKVIVGTPVKSVSLSNKDKASKIEVNSTLTLKAVVSPSTASYKKIKWKSSNPSVLSVNTYGKIKGLKNGSATITGTAGDGSKKKVKVKVKVYTLAKSVTISSDADRYIMKKGKTIELSATIKPDTTSDKSLTWTSSNENVATVDNNGKVTAIDEGYSKITVTTSNNKKDSFTVHVYGLHASDSHFIAHRGYSEAAPENSKSAYRLALTKGYYGVECDVQLTSDGEFVLSHDDNMERCFGQNIRFDSTTYSAIKSYYMNAGNKIENYPSETLCTLKEYMDIMSTSATVHPVLDIKFGNNKEALKKMVDLVDSYNMNDRVEYISFDSAVVMTLKSIVNKKYDDSIKPDPTVTPVPTKEPTKTPTAEPTPEPTAEPTAEPTPEPTAEPTAEPTPEPTVEPTAEPTVEPTTEPTVEPIDNPTPTVEPTTEPTGDPEPDKNNDINSGSSEMDLQTTPTPTVEPTTEPTKTPTAEPTKSPTKAPTTAPEKPTPAPTAAPEKKAYVKPSISLISNTPEKAESKLGYKTPYQWCIDNGFSIVVNKNKISRNVVTSMHKAGLRVTVYTVDDFYEAFTYLKGLGVDAITTNEHYFEDD